MLQEKLDKIKEERRSKQGKFAQLRSQKAELKEEHYG